MSIRTKRSLALLFLASGLAAVTFPACRSAENSPALRMEEYVRAAHRFWKFQGSVLVAKGGEVVFEASLGEARVEDGVKNSPTTRFLIGSATKTFTAAAVLQLAEKGLLGLDDPLSKHVPEFPERPGAAITVRHLLNHTSGLPEAVPDPRTLGDLRKAVPPLDLIGLIRDKEPDFAPGERAAYSNIGYVLLGLVIERASGESYYDYMRKHILGRLGMTDSGFREDWYEAPAFAHGYIEGRDGRLVDAPRFNPLLAFSAGALFSTVKDLLKWDDGLRSDKVLSPASKDLMGEAPRGVFGHGWLVLEAWGRRELAHGGSAPGFDAMISRWPGDEAFVAVLSNVGGASVGEIARSLAAILFGEDYQFPEPREILPLDPAALDDYAGIYGIDADSRREILREGEVLSAVRDGGRRYPLLPYARDKFFFANDKGATIRFVRDEAGRVTAHVFHQGGLDQRAERIR